MCLADEKREEMESQECRANPYLRAGQTRGPFLRGERADGAWAQLATPSGGVSC